MSTPRARRTSAPNKVLVTFLLLALSVIGFQAFVGPSVLPIVPADRPHEFANGLGVRLLSIAHTHEDGEHLVTWSVELHNPGDTDLVLDPTTACRHVMPSEDVGTPGSPMEHTESVVVPAGQVTYWSDSCPSPDSGRWWAYTVRFDDPTEEHRYPPLTLLGRAH